jgi:hypothetical protein
MHGGKRTGAGRPTDNKNRKNVHYRIDAATAEKFVERCKYLRVPLNAVLECLVAEWMYDMRFELKGPAKFLEPPVWPDNLKDLMKKRDERRQILAVAEYRARKGSNSLG